MKTYRVGILGCTGMVGQRFCCLLAKHPWFKITAIAASPRSAGKKYAAAVGERWAMPCEIPTEVEDMTVLDASDIKTVTSMVDFVFCAVDMKKDEIKALEEAYAKAECPVISNNSINRTVGDIPMIIPELNPHHADIIPIQRKRLGTKKGFIAVKSNCSIQSYIPALMPLDPVYGLKDVLVCTYQAISGAGKTFDSFPEMVDNVIPYIGGGEEEKSEVEPLKIMGKIIDGKIVPSSNVNITAQCIRVPVTDGHLAAVFARFEKKPDLDQIKKIWYEFTAEPQKLHLPSAPKQFLHYFEEQDYPQIKLHRDLENGMAVSIGRLREDSQYDIKFIGLSHNTLRGAAGGGVLCAELLCEKGYI
ncbi:MAG TPA: aspartate-semialdehyde dehydrogenase [Oscillospiraceae bacterium]|nr:aspartate-semialdehyde dehydrogenase [Oscillospiraceae bacterium]HPS34917.1 aspartate-semialdehyde dehydrogenase [Oscillospiraceae bacterium]